MIATRNAERETARILHDVSDLLKAASGSLWRERAVDIGTVGRDGGNPCYIMATGSGRAETAYVAFGIDDGSGYTGPDEHGVFLPGEHAVTYPLVEVTDGTTIVIGNEPR